MRWRELRPAGCLAGLLLAAVVGVECSFRYEGSVRARYVVTVESTNPNAVRNAKFFFVGDREWANEEIQRLTEDRSLDSIAEGPAAELVSDRSFMIEGLGDSSESPFRIAADRLYIYPWVMIFVELADGSRWAKVEAVPDPRGGPKPITCRLDEGRQFRPPQPRK